MPDLPEVSNITEFAWIVAAAILAGIILYAWDQVKGKVGVTA